MRKKKIFILFLVIFTMMLSSFAFYAYQILYTPNVLIEQEDRYFAIPKGTSFKQLQNQLSNERIVNDLVSFSVLAKFKNLDTHLKAGMYLIKKNMTNLNLIRLLRSGSQTPINLTFSNARLLHQLPQKFSKNLEIDSATLASFMLNDTIAKHYGFNENTFISMFIPNTYKVYWTITPKDLLNRMEVEYNKFWTKERVKKAKTLSMSQIQVATLAAIVQSETNKTDEMPTIAGVYINRLKKGIPLQADPTLIFAIGDFSIRRVLDKDKKFNSLYNTYKNKGLPPGPICTPNITSIDAVLNYENHEYLYFCAKANLSGYHSFAKTLKQHNINARKFHRALNKNKIYR